MAVDNIKSLYCKQYWRQFEHNLDHHSLADTDVTNQP